MAEDDGLRAIKIIPKDGSPPFLIVTLLMGGREVMQFPGESVAPLRRLLQRIEAENPGLCGDDTAAKDSPVDRYTFDSPDGDPTLN